MKKTAFCAAILFSFTTLLFAAEPKHGLQLSFNSDDPHAHLGARLDPRNARLTITTRDGSTSLILTNDNVAVQLTDAAIANIKADDNAGFLEELLASGVRTMMNKSLSFPIAYLRDAEIVNGAIVITQENDKPLFTDVRVNRTEVMHDFAPGDAARFVNAFRAVKGQR